ncbi:MAG: sigma-70 family RNA polymerase sigma factor [Myxococcales bacterium]|nr:sigma-70 family RNA polymerase sigma factor [Myxococcales bacterium]
MSSPASLVALPRLRLLEEKQGRESLADALRARRPWAERALLETHAPFVERLLTRILGFESELEDLVQEVFVRAFSRIDDLRDDNLKSWIGAFAVNVARETLRRRRRRRWLSFASPEEVPDVPTDAVALEIRDAARALYTVLSRMNASDRVVFTLRLVEGMQLSEIAVLCDVSLSTVKRRMERAQAWFSSRARRDPRLAEWVIT